MTKKTDSKKKKRVSKKNKKTVEKKNTRKGKTTKVIYHSTKEIKMEKVLVENFVGLQKVMVNLSSKFDNLASQISKLLELFEISARVLAKQDFVAEKEDKDSKKILEKVDILAQQAGLIGKGLALIHEANTGKEISPVMKSSLAPKPMAIKKPIPISPKPDQKKPQSTQGYQRSIISTPEKLDEVS